ETPMHARGWVRVPAFVVLGVVLGVVPGLLGAGATAAADPAPKPVDIKALKAKPIVLQDATGGTYVVFRDPDEAKVFYGPNAKAVYEQVIIGSSSEGEGRWEYNTWAPRVAEGPHLGSIERKKDGTFQKSC